MPSDQIALPCQLPRPAGALTFWVIFRHPKDYPNGYVLRAQWAVPGHPEPLLSKKAWYARTPDELHSLLPMWSLTLMGPQEGDDPVIYEVWME